MRAAACVLAATLAGPAAAADLELRDPTVDVRELELDYKLSASTDRARSHIAEIEYGVNEWWSPAIEGEWTSAPGEATRFEATAFESRLRFTRRGAWAQVGLFVEIERGADGMPHSARVGPILRKDVGRVANVLNVFAVREWGSTGARGGTTYSYAWQSRWRISKEFQPGLEVYGGALETGAAAPKQRMAGPVFFGGFKVAREHELRYEIGYLRGLDSLTPQGTVKLLLGYEYRFD